MTALFGAVFALWTFLAVFSIIATVFSGVTLNLPFSFLLRVQAKPNKRKARSVRSQERLRCDMNSLLSKIRSFLK